MRIVSLFEIRLTPKDFNFHPPFLVDIINLRDYYFLGIYYLEITGYLLEIYFLITREISLGLFWGIKGLKKKIGASRHNL